MHVTIEVIEAITNFGRVLQEIEVCPEGIGLEYDCKEMKFL